jgi:hypothetical protein
MSYKTSSKSLIINDTKIVKHLDVFYTKGGFTLKQQQSTIHPSALVIYDIRMCELKNYYHTLLDVYPTLSAFFDKRVDVCFRDGRKKIKHIIPLNAIATHARDFFECVYPNFTIVDNNTIKTGYKEVFHTKYKKNHSLIHKDLSIFKTILLNRCEPANFITPSKVLIKRNENRHICDKIRNYLIDELSFTEIIPEYLTNSQQAKIFNNASVIIASHGACLANMVYSSSKTKIIELSVGYNTRCFSSMTRFNKNVINNKNFFQMLPDNYTPIPHPHDACLKWLDFYKPLESFIREYQEFIGI